jgi:hypothetical protein
MVLAQGPKKGVFVLDGKALEELRQLVSRARNLQGWSLRKIYRRQTASGVRINGFDRTQDAEQLASVGLPYLEKRWCLNFTPHKPL